MRFDFVAVFVLNKKIEYKSVTKGTMLLITKAGYITVKLLVTANVFVLHNTFRYFCHLKLLLC